MPQRQSPSFATVSELKGFLNVSSNVLDYCAMTTIIMCTKVQRTAVGFNPSLSKT